MQKVTKLVNTYRYCKVLSNVNTLQNASPWHDEATYALGWVTLVSVGLLGVPRAPSSFQAPEGHVSMVCVGSVSGPHPPEPGSLQAPCSEVSGRT